MKNLPGYFSTFLFSILICSNLLFAQGKKRGDPYAPGENIYKHYTGTIGDRKVVLDLVWGFQGGSNFGGSHFYFADAAGTYHFYITEPPTFDHNERLHANVVNDENPWSSERNDFSNADITLDFQMIDDKLIGMYHNKVTREDLEIRLAETFGKPLAFDIVLGSDMAHIPKNDGTNINAEIFTLGITPDPKTTNITEMDFVNKQLLKFGGTENVQAEYIADFYKEYRVTFIKGSKIYFTQLYSSGNAVNMQSPEYIANTVRRLFLLPVYNDTGFLVIRKDLTQGNKREVTYLNLDVVSAKQLQLNDILKVNHTLLSAMIESAFRKKYDLGNTGKLNQWLTVDRIPVSENFRLANNGIIFNYDKSTLIKDKALTYWDPEFSVYLTYAQLQGMLKKEFMARIWP